MYIIIPSRLKVNITQLDVDLAINNLNTGYPIFRAVKRVLQKKYNIWCSTEKMSIEPYNHKKHVLNIEGLIVTLNDEEDTYYSCSELEIKNIKFFITRCGAYVRTSLLLKLI
jgi:hypothetical protein